MGTPFHIEAVACWQLHESQAGYSGANFLSVERQSFREDRPLDHLTLLQGSLDPEPSRVRHEVLGEPEDALDTLIDVRSSCMGAVWVGVAVAVVAAVIALVRRSSAGGRGGCRRRLGQ